METQTNQNQLITPSKGEIILYQTADGRTSIDVKLENETVWLSSEQMALLFERDRTVIQRHIRNIYSEGELTRDTTCAKFAHMGRDGDQTYVTELFNLDVIISVGYRVKSKRGTQFRIWANSVLKDYLIRGYAVRSDLVQQKYDDLKALVDLMGRTMTSTGLLRIGKQEHELTRESEPPFEFDPVDVSFYQDFILRTRKKLD